MRDAEAEAAAEGGQSTPAPPVKAAVVGRAKSHDGIFVPLAKSIGALKPAESVSGADSIELDELPKFLYATKKTIGPRAPPTARLPGK